MRSKLQAGNKTRGEEFEGGRYHPSVPKARKRVTPMQGIHELLLKRWCPEIGDAFEHLMNIGGSGGVPVDDERCYLKAKSEPLLLKITFACTVILTN